MGEADGAPKGDGDGSVPGGRKRRRRRRPKRGSAQASRAMPNPPSTKEAVKGGAGARTAKKRGSVAKRRASKKKTTKSRTRAAAAATKREISSGGVVYRRAGGGIEVVLASRRTRRGELAWGLAKGGVEQDESLEDAAVREVREETGLLAEIEASLGETRYFYVWEDVRIRKTVHFFLMRHLGGDIDDRDDEMEEIRWFPLERALKRAAYRGERDVLGRAAELLQ
ncbi:MAG: NUDIX hydrolase [Actinomycetota bacterium]